MYLDKASIRFERASVEHIELIFQWLGEPHIMEFWDSTQAHKDDIVNFVNGRKTPSSYADGKYVYWIATFNAEPFAMIMSIHETFADDINQEKLERLSKTGNSYGLDFMIGNSKFFGKGYAARTLIEFMDFFRKVEDPKADTFLIDPEASNPRAKHVYTKAGFQHVCDFIMEGDCTGKGKLHHLLVKKFEPKISVINASLDDYSLIQNMARFYVYDLSRECGALSSDWAIPEDGLYESFDFKNYLTAPSRRAYLVKVYDEIAGFVLLNQVTKNPVNEWNMGEFFIIAKFQNQGIASRVARQIWEMHSGTWEVSVIPENKSALNFWEKAIGKFTKGIYTKEVKEYAQDIHQPKRIVFEFDTIHEPHTDLQIIIRTAKESDIDSMVRLSKEKRLFYEQAQPQFWRYSGESGDVSQANWFKKLLGRQDHIFLTAQDRENEIVGFIIGKLVPAPEVYDPGGLTLMVDDFCVSLPELWPKVGTKLIESVRDRAKDATQILVVCGAHDQLKRQFLKEQNLTIASEWYVSDISDSQQKIYER